MSWATRLATGFFQGATEGLPFLEQTMLKRDEEKKQTKREEQAAIREQFKAGDEDGAIAKATTKGYSDLASELSGIKRAEVTTDYTKNLNEANQQTSQAQVLALSAQKPEDLTRPLQQTALAQETALQQSAPNILSSLTPGQASADDAAQAFGQAYDTEFDLKKQQSNLRQLSLLQDQATSEPDITHALETQIRAVAPADTVDTIIAGIKADKRKDKLHMGYNLADNPHTARAAAKMIIANGGDPAIADMALSVAKGAEGDEAHRRISSLIDDHFYDDAAALADSIGEKDYAQNILKRKQQYEEDRVKAEKDALYERAIRFFSDDNNRYPKDATGYPDRTKPPLSDSQMMEKFNQAVDLSKKAVDSLSPTGDNGLSKESQEKVDAAVRVSKAAYQADPTVSATMIEQKMRNDGSFSEQEIFLVLETLYREVPQMFSVSPAAASADTTVAPAGVVDLFDTPAADAIKKAAGSAKNTIIGTPDTSALPFPSPLSPFTPRRSLSTQRARQLLRQ